MSLDFTDDQSTLGQVMIGAIRQQAITWTNVDLDLSSDSVTGPEWVNLYQMTDYTQKNVMSCTSQRQKYINQNDSTHDYQYIHC